MTGIVDAVNESYTLFTTVWDAGAQALLSTYGALVTGYLPEIRYQRVEKDDNLPREKYWARLSYVVLSESRAAIGNRYFAGVILFTMQIMCPKKDAAAATVGLRLAQLACSAVRGKETASGFGYFENAKINAEVDEANWIVFSASAECNYDDFV